MFRVIIFSLVLIVMHQEFSVEACVPLPRCLEDGDACDINNPQMCCSVMCSAGICGPPTCLPDGSVCVVGEECCSGYCEYIRTSARCSG